VSATDRHHARSGAYGLHLRGLEPLDDLLVPAEKNWPTAQIEVQAGSIDGASERVDESSGTIVFRDAMARLERAPARAVFRFAASPTLDAVVHPYLAPVAGLFAHWQGRECLHAGGFVHDGVAWGLVADRGGGKSSTLAQLALLGVPVLTDDLMIVDDGRAFAGPRVIDLREEPAAALGVGEPLGVLGTRPRWRFRIPAATSSAALGGWVFLDWGTSLSVEVVPPSARLERLGQQRMIRRRPADPSSLLSLASFPAIVIRRPRSWALLQETTTAMLDALPAPLTTD
jgi:hypothetical protein